jgi:hypothetical protein
MSQVVLNALQWSSLAYIDDVRPIDDSDAACLEEIRLVFGKAREPGPVRHRCSTTISSLPMTR